MTAAAFFDLDRTLLRRSSALALDGPFREYGVIGRVIRMIRQGDNAAVILVHGEQRMRLKQILQQEPFMKAEVVKM